MAHSRLDHFLTALHRRLVLAQVMERAGWGVAAACVAAIIVMPIRLARHESALVIGVILIALGAIIGIAWGWIRRPTRLAAAMEADRQLRLAELLGTALALQRDPQQVSNPWAQTIVQLATQRCARVSPSAILVRRWNGRAWGGVALGVGMVLALGLLGPRNTSTQAASDPEMALAQGRLVLPTTPTIPTGLPSAQDSARPRWMPHPSDPNEPRDFQTPPPPEEEDGSRATDSHSDQHSTGQHGSGSGEAHGQAKPQGQTPLANPQYAPAPQVPEGQSPDGVPTPGLTAAPNQAASDSNWSTDTWPHARQAAEQAIGNGAVPDDYAPLIRRYFGDK